MDCASIREELKTAAREARAAAPLTPEDADRWRIRRHLAQVEAKLRAAPTPGLSRTLRSSRARHLDVLHAYWTAGVFPRNTDHPHARRPYFIDDGGRACAVAHLMDRSGAREIALHIDRILHNAYVPDMADAELLQWAAASGLTVEELTQIQPSYCQCGGDGEPQAYAPVCGGDGLTYWNACAASMCGGVSIAHEGECSEDGPRCEVCGSGTSLVAVAECGGEFHELGEGQRVCDRTGGDDVVAVHQDGAVSWLAAQADDCPAGEPHSAWYPIDDRYAWEECRQQGEGGEGGSGVTEPDEGSGCTTGASRRGAGSPLWLLLLAGGLVFTLRRGTWWRYA